MSEVNEAENLSARLPLEGDAWDAPRAFWQIAPRVDATLDDRVATLERERELRDFYARYFDALDSRHLESILSFFHEDAVYAGDERIYVGKDAIRKFYESNLPTAKAAAHNTGNVTVRLMGNDDAYINSRNFTVLCQPDDRLRGIAANVTLRLVEGGAGWLIVERRTSVIADYVLTPHPSPADATA